MKKILIVDDKQEVRELVDVTLQVEDYHILQCNNGDDAIKIATAEQPDLIIMDVMMPGEKDGFQATSIIKGAEKTKHCKVIMLTGKGQDLDKERGYSMGADEYFVKPFSPLDLNKKVEEVL